MSGGRLSGGLMSGGRLFGGLMSAHHSRQIIRPQMQLQLRGPLNLIVNDTGATEI